jgi:polar amino acid transport system substrate-binding protein
MEAYYIQRYLYCAFFALSMYWALAAQVSAEQTIQISASEAPPYSSESVVEYGYNNHVIQCAFKQQDISVEFVFMPWSRAYKGTMEGKFPVSSYWYFDPKHEKNFLISDPISNERIVFFRRKTQRVNQWASLADFSKLRLGLTRGYTYTTEIWDYAKANSFYFSVVNSDTQNLKMLLLDRIDVFPVEEIVGWYILNNSFAKEQVNLIETMVPPVMFKTGHLLFSKKLSNSKALLQSFNKGLEKCREQGILQKYAENLTLGFYKKK